MGGDRDDVFAETEDGTEQEALQEEDTATEEEVPSQEAQRMQALEEKLDRLMAMNASKGSDAPSVDTKVKLTKEQQAAIKEDPSLLVEILENHTKKVTQEVQGQLQQSHWDQKAYKDFPSLNNDKKFESLVTREIQQLVATGAMGKDHPQLLYHAARLASANYKSANGGTNQVKRDPKNAMAPGSRQKGTSQQGDTTDVRKLPEYQYLKMAWNDDEKIAKAIANHKRREVETRVDPSTGKTRRILQLNRRVRGVR